MIRFAALALIPFLSACPADELAGTQNAPLGEYQRATLQMDLDGAKIDGAGVAQRKAYTKITVQIPDKTKQLFVRTCHRHLTFANPPRPFVYAFSPAGFLENDGSCVAFISALRETGQRVLGIVDWTADERGVADLDCNGTRAPKVVGASFCQSWVGLVQALWFAEPVEMASLKAPECLNHWFDANRFFYRIGKGLCVYAFKLKSGEYHRHTSWGYDNAGID